MGFESWQCSRSAARCRTDTHLRYWSLPASGVLQHPNSPFRLSCRRRRSAGPATFRAQHRCDQPRRPAVSVITSGRLDGGKPAPSDQRLSASEVTTARCLGAGVVRRLRRRHAWIAPLPKLPSSSRPFLPACRRRTKRAARLRRAGCRGTNRARCRRRIDPHVSLKSASWQQVAHLLDEDLRASPSARGCDDLGEAEHAHRDRGRIRFRLRAPRLPKLNRASRIVTSVPDRPSSSPRITNRDSP